MSLQVPENIKDGIYVVLQQKLLPAKLNQQSNQNLRLLLGWADDEGFFKNPNATPDEIANVILSYVQQQSAALVWDIAPNFDAPAPKQLTKKEAEAELQRRQAEAQARDIKRRQEEQADNSEAAFFERQKQFDENKKIENDKTAAEVAERELQSAILSFEVYRGPNRVDHSRSEELRKALFQISVKVNGQRDSKATAKFVRELINELPDDATPNTVWQLVQKKNEAAQKAASTKPRRDSLGVL